MKTETRNDKKEPMSILEKILAYIVYWIIYFQLLFLYRNCEPAIKAIRLHHKCGQKYDDILPYGVHLKYVDHYGVKFAYLLTKLGINYEDACKAWWFHDTIEDCRLTWSDVVKLWNELVANVVYRCTNEKGKNRVGRANDKFYRELTAVSAANEHEHILAIYTKMCDRMANMHWGQSKGSSMHKKYVKEWPNFKKKIYCEELKDMFDYLENELS